MSGYSGTPLPRKLGIKEGAAVAFPGAPAEFTAALGALPDGVVIRRRTLGPLDVVVAFFVRARELRPTARAAGTDDLP